MALSNKRKMVVLLLTLFIVLTMVFSLSFNDKNAEAYDETYTLKTSEDVSDFLTKLKNGSYMFDSIYIGESTPIDCSGLILSPINFSTLKDSYQGAEVAIYFNIQLQNIEYTNPDYSCDTSPHHGLFTKVDMCEPDDPSLSVYYKVAFNVGNGTLNSTLSYYRYSVPTELPSVTPAEGDVFLGWREEGSESIVTSIPYDAWGVKTFNAVYESNGTEETPDDNLPTTYSIVYNDDLGAGGVELLDTTYTVGTELSLGVLEKEGFDFTGWTANGSVVTTLGEELQSGLLNDDGKIYLSAQWELKAPTLGALNAVSKIYDGEVSTLSCDVEHSLLNELTIEYEWYKKDVAEPVSTSETLDFKDVVNAEYKLSITAKHSSSNLSKTVESEYVSVIITERELTVLKQDGDYDLSKIYDMSNYFFGAITSGIHYEVSGIVGDDDVSIQNVSAEYSDTQAGAVDLVVEFSGIKGAQVTNYKFGGVLLSYATSIAKKSISINKLTSPTLSKDYDGTTDVEYTFMEGEDFEFIGALEEVSHTTTAKYLDKSAGDTEVVLSVEIQNDNYQLLNGTLEYDAIISKLELSASKLSAPIITKVYDGTKTVEYNFKYGADFEIINAVSGEIKNVSFTAIYDNASVSATKVIIILGNLEFNEGASVDNYDYLANTIDLYYDAGITSYELTVSGKDAEREYEAQENLIENVKTGIGADSVDVKYIRESGNAVGEYGYVGVELVSPVNANYTLKFIDDGKVYKIVPSLPTIVFPTFKTRDYDVNTMLCDEDLVDTTNYQKDGDSYLYKYGVFRWIAPSTVANANDEIGYDMVFTPNDVTNYDYSKVDGYDTVTNAVRRKVVLAINKATPVPTEVADRFIMPIGMKYNRLTLAEGWSVAPSEAITSSSVARGDAGSTATFENALVYEHDDSGNYKKIYKDLVVDFVLPRIVFVNGVNSIEGSPISVIRNLNESIALRIELCNPFEKEGYRVGSWTFADGTNIYPSGSDDQTYDIVNPDLVELTIGIQVNIVARSDVKVEFRHYYENMGGGFDDENMEIVETVGTSDAVRGISYADLNEKQGFNFIKATLVGVDEEIENFTVSPCGDSVVAFYYERKTITINYIDTLYVNLASEGDLPSSKIVKYGVPFVIDRPVNYLVYGYNFVGYTDGITTENGSLKIISDTEYVVNRELDSITFTLHLTPSARTLYVIKRYVGDECITENHYGVTGESVDITNVEYVGHKRFAHENERLKGVISGNVLDDEGNVIKGDVLTLSVYYKVESFIVSLPDEVDVDFMIAEYGEVIILPSAPKQEDNKEFLGWVINGVLYAPGESFVMPATDVIITARWEKTSADVENDTNGEIGNQNTSRGDTEVTTNDDKLDSGVVIGIIVGGVVFIVAIGMITGIVARRQKKREELIDKLKELNNNMF